MRSEVRERKEGENTVNTQLEALNEMLEMLMRIEAGVASIETAVATCSLGQWKGKSAQLARGRRSEIVVDIGRARQSLQAAQAHLDSYRSDLVITALAAS